MVSVIADGNATTKNPIQRLSKTLLQDARITRENIDQLFEQLYDALLNLEKESIQCKKSGDFTLDRSGVFQLFDYALLSLDLLPKEALPGIVLFFLLNLNRFLLPMALAFLVNQSLWVGLKVICHHDSFMERFF
jgi:hypothetical protein